MVIGRTLPHRNLRHPYQYHIVLTSPQLAAYVQLPRLEASGFRVKLVPSFDVVPPSDTDGGAKTTAELPAVDPAQHRVRLGNVIVRSTPSETVAAFGLAKLNRHAFVSGITGSGKTNTIFAVLRQVAACKIPFVRVMRSSDRGRNPA